DRDRAEQRIGRIDRLELDQRAAAVTGARHRAHGGGHRETPLRLEEGALRRGRLALAEAEREVAAQDGAALARESLVEARGKRADAGDRHYAEGDAADEHVE